MPAQPSKRKILFLAANSKDTSRLRLDEEIRNIREGLKLSIGRDNFVLISRWAVRTKDLRRALLEHTPQIVHFSGHGAGKAGLVLEDEAGHAQSMSSNVLARLFKLCPSVECVLLNACYSEVQATAIATHIPYVIGMNQAIGDATAIKFAVGFYDALGYSRTYEDAYEFGVTAIGSEPIIVRRDISSDLAAPSVGLCNPVTPILMTSASLSQRQTTSHLSRQAYRNRQALLNKVKNYWIKGVLERSLHSQILIELGLEERLDFADPFNMALGMVNQPQQNLVPGTQIVEVFDRLGEGRSLLILGEPGSGKTITLLQLTRDLVARAEENVHHLMPIVFNLSSWDQGRTLEDWLVEELNTKYQVPKSIGASWVKQQKLLLMLDGLDEVQIDNREACVEAINQFQQAHGTEMVVCSRIKDYEKLSHRLTVQQAIYMRSLTSAQVDGYLTCLNTNLTGLKALLAEDSTVKNLARSPLMLNIMVLAYENIDIADFPKTPIENHHQRLFDTYIHRMLKRRGVDNGYSLEQINQWLSWLAQQLERTSQTIFLIERIDYDWLQTARERWVYNLISSLITGFVWAWVVALSMGFGQHWVNIGLLFWIVYCGWGIVSTWAVRNIDQMSPSSRQRILKRLVDGVWLGVSTGAILGTVAGLETTANGGLLVGVSTCLTIGVLDWCLGGEIGQSFLQPVETLSWSWTNIKRYLLFGMIGATPFGLLLGLAGVLGPTPIYGVLLGALGGFILGLFSGLRAGAAVEMRSMPNQGIWYAAKASVIISVGVSVILSLGLYLLRSWVTVPPYWSLYSGALVGLITGGIACIIHVSLRTVLYFHHHMPWNYARFLDDCCDHILLQKVGGGYIFIHRSLMEYFTHR